MARTVNQAFIEFLENTVNSSKEKEEKAKNSLNNLIENIKSFSEDEDFFAIYDERILKYGSFERKTKTKPIDDIDIMICMSAEGSRTYDEKYDGIYITGNNKDIENNLCDDKYINSTKVINRYIKKLENLNDYKKAEMHKNHEAATLQLNAYEWNFDIVPCFYTTGNFYLIPDGNGEWKKTDPRIDNERIITINSRLNGNLLDVIKILKYWNNRKVTIKINSYLLECLILKYYEDKNIEKWYIDYQCRHLFKFLSTAIMNPVYDPKNIQGDINNIDYIDKITISNDIKEYYKKTEEAYDLEINENNHEKAINKWKEVFGNEFPDYLK